MATGTISRADDLIRRLRRAEDGETLTLAGQFGAVAIAGIRMRRGVTLTAAEPGAAHFERIKITDCAGLTLEGLQCWPKSPVPRSRAKPYLITAFPNCSGIEVSNCLFRGRADSDGHAAWNLEDWRQAKIGAVLLRGAKSVIRSCAAIGVNFGFGVGGPNSEIYGNLVFGFSGDGLRVTEDNCVVIGNRVTDAMQIDGNHSDGFQAFKTSGLLNGLVVKDNVLIEWTVKPDNPLRAKMQGLSLHDGPYANVVVRGNVIACSTWNGIRLNGVRDLEVTGNRVLHIDGKRGNQPWIRVGNCSGRIVVHDNEAEKFDLQRGVIQSRNQEPNYSMKF